MKTNNWAIAFLLGATVLTHSQSLQAQPGTQKDLQLIQASQGAASATIFEPHKKTDLISPGTFYHEGETNIRAGLPNTLSLLTAGRPATIAYIGGSITQGEYGYRQQSAKYIANRFPKSKIRFINAGVSGTGTDLGACRLQEMVLIHKPDLVFIEFAVNGAYQPGMEGMIRQIKLKNPKTDICLIYTISTGQTEAYTNSRVPENIKGLETLADHYGVSSIHLGMEPAALEKADKLIWKGSPESANGRILFSTDGIHPLQAGGDLYAAAMARAFVKFESKKTNGEKTFPAPLLADNWEKGAMYSPEQIAVFKGEWKKQIPAKGEPFHRYLSWFPYVMTSSQAGSSFSFEFEGDAFGLFDIGGPEVGQIEIAIDGNPVKLTEVSTRGYHLYEVEKAGTISTINRFNAYCNNRYRGQYDIIKVPHGKHQVTVTLSGVKADKAKILGKNSKDISENPAKYDQTVLHLGRILIKGTPVMLSKK